MYSRECEGNFVGKDVPGPGDYDADKSTIKTQHGNRNCYSIPRVSNKIDS